MYYFFLFLKAPMVMEEILYLIIYVLFNDCLTENSTISYSFNTHELDETVAEKKLTGKTPNSFRFKGYRLLF